MDAPALESDVVVARNKDGSIRKRPGRKAAVPRQLEMASTIDNSSLDASTGVRQETVILSGIADKGVSNRPFGPLLEMAGPVPTHDFLLEGFRRVMADNHQLFAEKNALAEKERELAERERELAERERGIAEKERKIAARELALTDAQDRIQRENNTYRPDEQATKPDSSLANKSDHCDRNELLGFRMKVEKFKGSEAEDYDVWWEDLQAYFALHSYSEKDKIRLFNAHLGGEARKFLQNEDMEKT